METKSGGTEHHQITCLNCGAPLHGKYCHSCGQKHIPKKESVWHMLVHFAGDFVHFDSKLIKTLRPLLLHPGKLPEDFVKGKRQRYLDPVKMYVFLSIFFFTSLHFINKIEPMGPKVGPTPNQDTTLVDSAYLDSSSVLIDSTLFHNVNEAADILNDSLPVSETKDTTENADSINPKITDSLELDFGDLPKTIEEYEASQDSLPDAEKDGWLARYFTKKGIHINQKMREDNVSFMASVWEVFKKNMPKLFFILLPFMALVLKLVHILKNIYYIDHIIFSVYFYCFNFVAIPIILLCSLISEWLMIPGAIWVLLYSFMSMLNFYKDHWAISIIKYLIFWSLFTMFLILGFALNFFASFLVI